MTVFQQLGKLRAFEKTHLPYLVTLEDFDIVRVIGVHQESKEPLLLKQLYLEGICSYATLTRRLQGLRKNGVVRTAPSAMDRRATVLLLSPPVFRTYQRYGHLLRNLAG